MSDYVTPGGTVNTGPTAWRALSDGDLFEEWRITRRVALEASLDEAHAAKRQAKSESVRLLASDLINETRLLSGLAMICEKALKAEIHRRGFYVDDDGQICRRAAFPPRMVRVPA